MNVSPADRTKISS